MCERRSRIQRPPVFAESPAQSRNDPTNAAGAQRLQNKFQRATLTFLALGGAREERRRLDPRRSARTSRRGAREKKRRPCSQSSASTSKAAHGASKGRRQVEEAARGPNRATGLEVAGDPTSPPASLQDRPRRRHDYHEVVHAGVRSATEKCCATAAASWRWRCRRCSRPGVVGRACRGSDRGRERDGGAGGEAALVTEKGQQEAAADFGKTAGGGGRGWRDSVRARRKLRVTWILS